MKKISATLAAVVAAGGLLVTSASPVTAQLFGGGVAGLLAGLLPGLGG